MKREGKGFELLGRRWVVERTFAWLMKKRRLIVDYETLPETSESFIYITRQERYGCPGKRKSGVISGAIMSDKINHFHLCY